MEATEFLPAREVLVSEFELQGADRDVRLPSEVLQFGVTIGGIVLLLALTAGGRLAHGEGAVVSCAHLGRHEIRDPWVLHARILVRKRFAAPDELSLDVVLDGAEQQPLWHVYAPLDVLLEPTLKEREL